MNRQQFIEHVRNHGSFPTDEAAAQAVDDVVTALAASLHPDDAKRIAGEGPRWLGDRLLHASGGPKTAQEFLYQVAHTEGIDLGFARECTSMVLQSLWQALSLDGRRWLIEALPPELVELAEPKDSGSAPVGPAHGRLEPSYATMARGEPPGARNSLSRGKPGSEHPVSEARLGYSKRSLSDSPGGSRDPLSGGKPGQQES